MRDGEQGPRTSSQVCGGALGGPGPGEEGPGPAAPPAPGGSGAAAGLKRVRGSLPEGEDGPGSPCRRDPWGDREASPPRRSLVKQGFTDDDGPRTDGTTRRGRRVCPRLLAAGNAALATAARQCSRQAPRTATCQSGRGASRLQGDPRDCFLWLCQRDVPSVRVPEASLLRLHRRRHHRGLGLGFLPVSTLQTSLRRFRWGPNSAFSL